MQYRLAPEHPFPAAYDDAFAAWQFLRAQGIAASGIAIGGDSAGGNLTLRLSTACAVKAKPRPVRGSPRRGPISPCPVRRWFRRTPNDPLIHKGYLEELAAAYVPIGMDRKDPRISPLFADLKGFPPTIIQVGSSETLISDATALLRCTRALRTSRSHSKYGRT